MFTMSRIHYMSLGQVFNCRNATFLALCVICGGVTPTLAQGPPVSNPPTPISHYPEMYASASPPVSITLQRVGTSNPPMYRNPMVSYSISGTDADTWKDITNPQADSRGYFQRFDESISLRLVSCQSAGVSGAGPQWSVRGNSAPFTRNWDVGSIGGKNIPGIYVDTYDVYNDLNINNGPTSDAVLYDSTIQVQQTVNIAAP